MSKFLSSAVLVLAIGAAPAFAATTAAPAAKPAAPATAADKKADCMKQWAAQKKHTKTMKAFMAACTK